MTGALDLMQDRVNLIGNPVGCEPERLVYMDIALRYAAGRMTQQRGNGQFGKAQVCRDAGKCVPQCVRSHAVQLRARTQPIEHPNDADKVALAPIRREEVR